MRKTVEKILLDHDSKPENVLAVLKQIGESLGYVSKKDAQKVANYFGLPLSRVYETASFYALIETEAPPSIYIKICSSTNCVLSQSNLIRKAVENYFRIKAGDDNNSRVKVEMISCVGECAKGPVMFVNGKMYSNVTPSDIYHIFSHYV